MESMTDLPEKFPTVVADRILYIFQRSGVGEFIIQLEMEFDRRLDPDRLRRAFFLALEAHPVLGCRLVPDIVLPFWQRLTPPDDLFVIAADEADFHRFRVATIDPTVGPQLGG
jgi:NRPS condensation-like uncharacterized protein